MHFFIPLFRQIPRYTFTSCQAVYYWIIGSRRHFKIILKLSYKEFMVSCILPLSFAGDVLLN